MVRAAVLTALLGLGFLGMAMTAQMGAGFSGGAILLWDISALSASLTDAGYPGLEGSPVLYGGLGFWGEGIRFGGGGFGGSLAAREGNRSSRLSVGFGGVAAEIPVLDDPHFDAAVGLLAGGGGAELVLRTRIYSSFGDAVGSPSDLYLTRGFWAFLPYVAAEFWPVEWFGLRVMVGNLITIAGRWEADGTEFDGPPESFGGPFLCFMAAFGGRTSEGPAD